jgi:hypothetical protein
MWINAVHVEGDPAGAAVCAGLLALALHQGHLPSPPLPLPPHQDLPHPQVKLPLISLKIHCLFSKQGKYSMIYHNKLKSLCLNEGKLSVLYHNKKNNGCFTKNKITSLYFEEEPIHFYITHYRYYH